jgi:hypothetical protein
MRFIFDLAVPTMDCFASLAMTNATLPRLRGEVGDGAKQSLRVSGTIRESEPAESPPSPARKMLATSPRKRGEVKNGRRASNGLLRWSLSSGAPCATRWLADGLRGEIYRCVKTQADARRPS